MDSELVLKVNKFIHNRCEEGTPHDIGYEVVKLIEAETGVKLFCQPVVMRSVCCDSHLVNFDEKYYECFVCGKLQAKQQTDA